MHLSLSEIKFREESEFNKGKKCYWTPASDIPELILQVRVGEITPSQYIEKVGQVLSSLPISRTIDVECR